MIVPADEWPDGFVLTQIVGLIDGSTRRPVLSTPKSACAARQKGRLCGRDNCGDGRGDVLGRDYRISVAQIDW